MKAQSKTYIALQSLYKNKARKDAAEVLDMAHALAADVAIDADEVEMFCTNAKFIKLINADKNTPSMDEIIGKYMGSRFNTMFKVADEVGSQRESLAMTRLPPSRDQKCPPR